MDQEKQHNIIHSADEKEEPFARHGELAGLDPYHARYLMERHGTLELDPLPSADPLDPLNWASWRKNTYLVIFAFHGMLAGVVAAGLVPAVPLMAETYGTSLAATTYLLSVSVRYFPFQLSRLVDNDANKQRTQDLLVRSYTISLATSHGSFWPSTLPLDLGSWSDGLQHWRNILQNLRSTDGD